MKPVKLWLCVIIGLLLLIIPNPAIASQDRQVRIDVMNSSDKKQVLWEASSLMGDFYFNNGRGISVVPKQPVKKEPKFAAIFPDAIKPKVIKKKKITNSLGMEFVYIKPGTFMMGSPQGERGRNSDEGPQHRVTFTREFYIQTTEVTQVQWKAIMGRNPSEFKGDDRPVEKVSWNDVQEFIRKLNQREGADRYRLPTEAEWEYAARAGSTSRFSFGDDVRRLGDYAWYKGNSGGRTYWYKSNSEGRTHPVGQKKPNAWGLYDMHGNVWEWCQDWYGKYQSGSATDPKGPSTKNLSPSSFIEYLLLFTSGGSRRVRRGGGWRHCPGRVRSAVRDRFKPDSRYNYLGFRLLRTN